MLVVLDANAATKDPFFRKPKWDKAQQAIEAGRLRVVLPEVARLELVGNFLRQREQRATRVKNAMEHATDRSMAAMQQLLDVMDEESAEYPNALAKRLGEIGIETPAPPPIDHLELVKRAVDRVPPFNLNGEGYRDTLVWLTALDQLDQAPFDDLVFYTEDGDFRNNADALRRELLESYGAKLTFLNWIGQARFPDEYENTIFELEDARQSLRKVDRTIRERLPGFDLTYRSPHPIDVAKVREVKTLTVDEKTIEVKKRYGQDAYEISAEAVAVVEAEVIIIHGFDEEPAFESMFTTWEIKVRWSAVMRDELEDESLDLLGVDEPLYDPYPFN